MAAPTTSSLRFEGGDTIIRLSNLPEDTLILHSAVLKAVSPRFRTRMSGSWAQHDTTEVEHPVTKQKTTLYTYRIVYDDDAFTISDEDKPLEVPAQVCFRPFYQSDFCTGFTSSRMYGPNGTTNGTHCEIYYAPQADKALDESIRAHKALFTFLYQLPTPYTQADNQTTLDITNAIGLAEYYDLLPAVAAAIESTLLGLEGLWQDVARDCMLYLCIGVKLRSAEVFSDALRHFVGAGGTYRMLVECCDADKETLWAFVQAQDGFEGSTECMVERIRLRCMTYYRGHANAPTVSGRDDPVRTNFLDASFSKNLQDKCKFLARSAFREWFDQQIMGQSHWSHVKYSRTSPKNGQVEVGSLRKTCAKLLAAAENKYDIDVISQNVARKYAGIFNLRQQKGAGDESPAVSIAKELRGILKEAEGAIMDCFELYHGKKAANHDKGLNYFTTMAVEEKDLPWAELREWEAFEMPGVDLTEVSSEWLQVVGGAGGDEDDEWRTPIKIVSR